MDNIERTTVDESEIANWDTEYSFLKLSTDLMIETIQYTSLLANTFPEDSKGWSIEEAVIGGHLVRLCKLFRHSLVQARDKRAEMLWTSIRLSAECIVNLRFLLENRTSEVIQSFVHYSLQHEKKLVEAIEFNIEEHGGVVAPIEDRMLKSCMRWFRNSEVELSDLPKKRIANWANKNVRERARAVGLEDTYLGIFSGPSTFVHGNWGDFLQNHLEVLSPGLFMPDFKDARARPQPFFSLVLMVLPGLVGYAQGLGVGDGAPIFTRLADLEDRVFKGEELHEKFLCEGQV